MTRLITLGITVLLVVVAYSPAVSSCESRKMWQQHMMSGCCCIHAHQSTDCQVVQYAYVSNNHDKRRCNMPCGSDMSWHACTTSCIQCQCSVQYQCRTAYRYSLAVAGVARDTHISTNSGAATSAKLVKLVFLAMLLMEDIPCTQGNQAVPVSAL